MTFSHLLDTNVLSRLMREPNGVSARHLAQVGEENVCTSVVVACELRFGATLRGSDRLVAAVERVSAVERRSVRTTCSSPLKYVPWGLRSSRRTKASFVG